MTAQRMRAGLGIPGAGEDGPLYDIHGGRYTLPELCKVLGLERDDEKGWCKEALAIAALAPGAELVHDPDYPSWYCTIRRVR